MNTTHSDTDDPNGDGEGVWSPDIEQCFREALMLFPPCGRRKHILQEEGGGKMYGRNELIARHIRMRTGKIRSRKQVSSHIQVLARRKARAESGSSGDNGPASSASPSSSIGAPPQSVLTSDASMNGLSGLPTTNGTTAGYPSHCDQWADRPIVTSKIRLVEFSAFIEYRRPLSALGFASEHKLAFGGPAAAALPQGVHQPHLNPHLNPHPHHLHNNNHQLGLPPEYAPGGHLAHETMNFNNHHPSAVLAGSLGGHLQSNGGGASPRLQQNPSTRITNGAASNYMAAAAANGIGSLMPNFQQSSSATSSAGGLTRHSYVKIDYREPNLAKGFNHLRHHNHNHNQTVDKLERIDICQIQDKFPEIGGSDGLFAHGPADAFFLVKFWADIHNDFECNLEDQNSHFGFSSHFETIDPFKDITCSTKACSYGLQVVEKVEKIYGTFNSSNGRYSYDIDRSPMCEFMIQFIKKLRQLSRASHMNSVLENFTVLQVITCEATSEILLCLAFVFEVASVEQQQQNSGGGSSYHVYKLTKD